MGKACKVTQCAADATIGDFCRYHYIEQQAKKMQKPRQGSSIDDVLQRVIERLRDRGEVASHYTADELKELCDRLGVENDLDDEIDDIRAVLRDRNRNLS